MIKLRGFQFKLATKRRAMQLKLRKRHFLLEKLEDRQTAGAALPLPYSLLDDAVAAAHKNQLEIALNMDSSSEAGASSFTGVGLDKPLHHFRLTVTRNHLKRSLVLYLQDLKFPLLPNMDKRSTSSTVA